MVTFKYSDYTLFQVDCTLCADDTLKAGPVQVYRYSVVHNKFG